MERQLIFSMLTATLVCGASVGWAQQETPPSPPTQAPQPSGQTPSQPGQTGTATPAQGETGNSQETTEMPPLSSGITLEPGSEGSTISYFLPAIQWTGFIDRLSSQNAEQSGTLSRSIYVADIVLQQIRRRTQLNLDYAVGGQVYGKPFLTHTNTTSPGLAAVHKFGASEVLKLRRLQLVFADQFTYLPESAIGFPGFTGLQSFGGGSGGSFLGQQALIASQLTAGETVLNGSGGRYVNTVIGEAQYSVTSRSVMTATVDYGIIHFNTSGYVNSTIESFDAGYNYRLSNRDQISATFVDSGFSYGASNENIVDQGLIFGYGHQFSGRFSVNLGAGPSAVKIARSQGELTISEVLLNAGVRYRSKVADLTGRFLQYTSAGSGLAHGAKTDSLLISASRRLIRRYNGTADIVHTYNEGLRGTSNGPVQFETWAVGFSIGHEFRQHASFYAQYAYQHQVSSSTLCTTFGCSAITIRQIVGAGINWHGRPHRIR